ncbi:hypothetical protein Lepto7375DRAFT_5258 [Leptolyngbya sp. PCC 7375]|nr:hypothetical protein Lepto7375DRAFT_5258 [Leptolyngbya sp. PCC 7375]
MTHGHNSFFGEEKISKSDGKLTLQNSGLKLPQTCANVSETLISNF